MVNEESTAPTSGVSRRTVMKGVAWAAPAIAVASVAPHAAASYLPCVSGIEATGGTYPVSISLSGCNTANSHWDFNFKITAALQDCDCERVRITMFDNPRRSRLWISQNNNLPVGQRNPSTNTNNSPQLYIRKELAPGATATFPAQGDQVRMVTNNNLIGTIGAHGTADDSLHAIINPTGGTGTNLPCGITGPMATYSVECLKSGTWTPIGENGNINPCVPMIKVDSVCRTNGRYRLGISVASACGIPAANFRITKIQRNSDTNFPNEGSAVWTGNTALAAGTTFIETNSTPTNGGSSLWVSFTTDNGVNTSIIRVNTNNSNC